MAMGPSLRARDRYVETNDVGDALDPEVAVGSSGCGVAAWRQSNGMRRDIWANRFE